MTRTESQTITYKTFTITTSFSTDWGWEYLAKYADGRFYEEGCSFDDEAEAIKMAMLVIDNSDFASEIEAEKEAWS